MHLKLLAALAAAAACWSSMAVAQESEEIIRAAELPADAPLYCERDKDAVQRVDGVTVGAFHSALSSKFPTWLGRVGLAHPDQPNATFIAVFGDFREDDSYDNLVRFYLTKHGRGWAVAYADFVEPDRPLMHSIGDPLCDYVVEAMRSRGAT